MLSDIPSPTPSISLSTHWYHVMTWLGSKPWTARKRTEWRRCCARAGHEIVGPVQASMRVRWHNSLPHVNVDMRQPRMSGLHRFEESDDSWHNGQTGQKWTAEATSGDVPASILAVPSSNWRPHTRYVGPVVSSIKFHAQGTLHALCSKKNMLEFNAVHFYFLECHGPIFFIFFYLLFLLFIYLLIHSLIHSLFF